METETFTLANIHTVQKHNSREQNSKNVSLIAQLLARSKRTTNNGPKACSEFWLIIIVHAWLSDRIGIYQFCQKRISSERNYKGNKILLQSTLSSEEL